MRPSGIALSRMSPPFYRGVTQRQAIWLISRDLPDKGSAETAGGPAEQYDERSGELQDCLAMLYFVVESQRSDPAFGEELSTPNSFKIDIHRSELIDSGHVAYTSSGALPDDRRSQR